MAMHAQRPARQRRERERSPGRRVRVLESLAFAGCMVAVMVGTPGPGDAAGIVTSVLGEASIGGEPVKIHDPITAGRSLETTIESRCSVLVSSNVLLQLCDAAEARIGDPDASGLLVVHLGSGSLKVNVEAGGETRLLEIHTPAAIATVSGSVVHVEVDAYTGDTTVASLEDDVRVESVAFPTREVLVASGEQVEVKAGDAPGRVHGFDRTVLRSSNPCLDDAPFRRRALSEARLGAELRAVDEIARDDVVADVDGIDVAAPLPSGDGDGPDDAAVMTDPQQLDLCFLDPTACAPLTIQAPARPTVCPPGPRGDHCL